ncbi:hypothetical protein RP20_CCG005214 [Aedes albopictus]|nr:hypothetical protein RP20_CCG005214 [Aedes albopictus]
MDVGLIGGRGKESLFAYTKLALAGKLLSLATSHLSYCMLQQESEILLWAKPEADTCRSPYEWACGRFEEKYIAHSLFGANKGEWNFDANRDYEETTAAYEFISKLPSVAVTYSTQAMLKRLHSICTTVETVSSNEVITSLKRALNDLGKFEKTDILYLQLLILGCIFFMVLYVVQS